MRRHAADNCEVMVAYSFACHVLFQKLQYVTKKSDFEATISVESVLHEDSTVHYASTKYHKIIYQFVVLLTSINEKQGLL